jgi:hypothetical protein
MHAGRHQFRVTKYDPSRRDLAGAYLTDEWTSYAHVGRSFGGKKLTEEEYLCVEKAYVDAAVAFLSEAAIAALTVKGLENGADSIVAIREGDSIATSDLPSVIASMLRDCCWCRLESSSAFVHIGHDYYMYIGVPTRCPRAEALAHKVGLFVESYPSPYAVDAA